MSSGRRRIKSNDGPERRGNGADQHLACADEGKDAARHAEIARQWFKKDTERARDRERGGDVSEKADGDNHPAVKELRSLGCRFNAVQRLHAVGCINDRRETTMRYEPRM